VTMPQGSTGIEPGGWMREWVSQDTLSGLQDRTKGQVEDYYLKGLELNSSWEFAQTSLFDGLMGGFKSLTEFLEKLALSISGSVNGTLEDIGEFFTDLVNKFADIAEKVADFFEELAEKLGLDKWQEFLNQTLAALGIDLGGGENGTTSLTTAEIEALAATTVANQTLIQQLRAELTAMGTPQGIAGGDDFETPLVIDTAPEWSSRGWVQALAGDGRMVVKDGHQAEWVSGSNPLPADKDVARYFRSAAADGNTKTPYQKISRVTGTQVAQNFLLAETNDSLQGRVSADRKNFIEMLANRNGVSLQLVVGGSVTPLESGACPGPSVGVAYTLECGTKDGLRVYRVLRNTAVVLVHADNTNKTAVLDANTGWGFGGISQGNLKPSSVHSVAVADNVPKT
jgi:hypothetical protein